MSFRHLLDMLSGKGDHLDPISISILRMLNWLYFYFNFIHMMPDCIYHPIIMSFTYRFYPKDQLYQHTIICYIQMFYFCSQNCSNI